MIKPIKKVHIEKDQTLPGNYYIETKDESVFKFLEEFGVVSPGNGIRWFSPSKLYDPGDIKEMLDSLDKTPPSLIQKATEMVKGLKKHDGETIETMRVGQRAYTLPWAYTLRYGRYGTTNPELKWGGSITSKEQGTSDMPITRISSDTWEIEPARSDFWRVARVKR